MAKAIKNMTDEDVRAVCEILDGWPLDIKLTWEALTETLERRLNQSWSRQALDRHVRIKQAYKQRKKSLRISAPSANEEHLPADLRKALESIRRLTSENERLTQENSRLMEQFVRWAYNASVKGLSEDVLNTPLPRIERGGTRE